MRTEIFTEENFWEKMDGEVKAWREASLRGIRIHSSDGTKLHGCYALHPDSRGAIVLVHGFTEYAEKFLEVMYYFYGEGYSVFAYDQRGHGRSGRKIPNPELVYVGSFDEYVEDLRCFIDRVVRAKAPDAPLFLFAHSMGGCVSALFLERHPQVFRAAVLNAPMLKMLFGETPEQLVRALGVASKALGWNDRPAPGAGSFSETPDFENSCALSKARYDFNFEQQLSHRAYRTSGATYAWARAAMAATGEVQKHAADAALPILICQAGRDMLVDNAGQDSFAANAPDAAVVRFPEAKHEIYRSTADILIPYYETIFDFFDKYSF